MSPKQLIALLRRHTVAVTMVFVLAAGLGYHIKHQDPGYIDTATVAFTGPQGSLFAYGQDLLVMDALATNLVMSQEGQQKIRKAGGTAFYDVALVNLNDEDFPNYSDPYVTVTTSSPDPAAAQATFSAVMHVLQEEVVSLQAQQAAPPLSWIGLRTITSTGPVAQTGSTKRMFAALLALAIIVAFVVATFLDRHPVRPRDLLLRRGLHGRTWGVAEARRNIE